MISIVWIVLLTVIIYSFMRWLYFRFSTPLLVPVATSTTLIVIFMLLTKQDFPTYMSGGKYIEALLAPSVVAFALPLYENRYILKKYALPLGAGVVTGVTMALVSSYLLAILFHYEAVTIHSLVPKSVTSPVAMEIAKELKGDSSLAVVYVMIAGIFGAMVGPTLLKWFGIHQPIGTGVGLGASAHGIGTAKALEIGTEEAAISSTVMTLCAIITAMICPFFF